MTVIVRKSSMMGKKL